MFRVNVFNIGPRIFGGFFIVFTLVIIFSFWIASGVKTIQKESQVIREELVPKELQLIEWQKETKSLLQMSVFLTSTSDEIKDEIVSEIKKTQSLISIIEREVFSEVDSEEARVLLKRVEKQKEHFSKILHNSSLLINKVNDGEKLSLIKQELKSAMNQYLDSINNLLYYEQNNIEKEHVRIETISTYILIELIIASFFILIIGLGVSLLIVRNITRPLRSMIHITREIASGNLSVEIKANTRGEFGVLMGSVREMTDNLKNIIREVQNGSDTIVKSASEIQRDSSKLAERTEEQAGTVEEIASALEELTSTIANTASNTMQAQQYMSSMVSQTKKNNEAINGVCLSMDEIYDLSSKMVHIIQTVDSISFQTNILALNAAVEAARAGESGRGFAVVAGEVRVLAQRCASAANETRELIDESTTRIINSRELAEKAGNDMSVMVDNIQKMMQWMEDITQACHEQSSGVLQLNSAMSQIDTTTQQNAAQVEESQVLVTSLHEQSQILQGAINIFTLADSEQKIETSHVPGSAVKKVDGWESF